MITTCILSVSTTNINIKINILDGTVQNEFPCIYLLNTFIYIKKRLGFRGRKYVLKTLFLKHFVYNNMFILNPNGIVVVETFCIYYVIYYTSCIYSILYLNVNFIFTSWCCKTKLIFLCLPCKLKVHFFYFF